MQAREAALAEALAPVGAARVLWIGVSPIDALDAARGANRASLDALPSDARFDAVVLGPTASGLVDASAAVRACVREGGVIAMVLPVERAGLRAFTQRALGAFDATRRARPLEEACGALLSAGVAPVKVIDVKGALGEAVVHGVVRAT
ncbi:hypothetical protein [Sandaracinus amylolyticus]|uniref:Uncharacterized protein n=1 Tax=Sandaracinus amylolyticus TaxID=927083 RepID=A0A0F6W7H9_9BACT|nr:hypothetical protein [Sandaracinus amylolyticus]AKF09240.1 hypothetical protein DB32_006389 [Sandaracinus amylolyticus]